MSRSAPPRDSPLEGSGGIECTVNRVGDRGHDQLAGSGHDDRAEDLNRIARLGIRSLRCRVLWECADCGPH